MNPIPKYLYANADGLGPGIILINHEPPLIGRIIYFDSYPEMLGQIPKFIASSIVVGYNILIAYGGILGAGNVLRTSTKPEQIESVLKEMSVFYLDYKILPHPSRFKRYQT